MMKALSINKDDLNAIMYGAVSTYGRENWLLLASDAVESGECEKAYEYIKERFEPYMSRLISASVLNDVTEENARHGFFEMFTKRVLG